MAAPLDIARHVLEGAGQCADVVRLHEAAVHAVGDELLRVGKTPTHDGESHGERFGARRPVRLGRTRGHVDISTGVDVDDPTVVDGAVHDDPITKPGLVELHADAPGVARVDVVAPDEVQRRHVGRQPFERVEKFEDALVREPVGDAQEHDRRTRAAWQGRCRSQFAARLGEPHPAAGNADVTDQVVDLPAAHGDHHVAASVDEGVEPPTESPHEPAAVDTAGSLVHRRDPSGRPAGVHPRDQPPGGDAVDHKDIGAGRASPHGDRDDAHRHAVRRRRLRHPSLVEVAAGQSLG
jgi:hypothetical protein